MKALMLLLLCSPVLADTVTYQSQTLPGSGNDQDGGQTWPVNDLYTITITVSGPLAPNLNNQVITPQSWVVTCVYCSTDLSSNPVYGADWVWATSAIFMFSTDATGKITAWNFALNGSANYPDGQGGIRFMNKGSFTSGDSGVSTHSGDGHYITISTSGPKGSWTQSSLAAQTLLARTCNGTWGVPNNNVAGGLTPNASGAGMNCRVPAYFPSSWYIKVTADGGMTYEFVTLASLGLGKAT
jgi:hypothetical protein